jgi:hypothetical protein
MKAVGEILGFLPLYSMIIRFYLRKISFDDI